MDRIIHNNNSNETKINNISPSRSHCIAQVSNASVEIALVANLLKDRPLSDKLLNLSSCIIQVETMNFLFLFLVLLLCVALNDRPTKSLRQWNELNDSTDDTQYGQNKNVSQHTELDQRCIENRRVHIETDEEEEEDEENAVIITVCFVLLQNTRVMYTTHAPRTQSLVFIHTKPSGHWMRMMYSFSIVLVILRVTLYLGLYYGIELYMVAVRSDDRQANE